MQEIKNLAEFIKLEFPNDAKELCDGLEYIGLTLDGVYDSIKKQIDTHYNSQNLDEISFLISRSKSILDIKHLLDEYILLLVDDEEIETEVFDAGLFEGLYEYDTNIEINEVPGRLDVYSIDTTVPHSLEEDFTYTKACGFMLNEKVYEAKNMRGVLVILCELLAKENKEKIKSFVTDPTMKGRKAPYFSDKFIVEDYVNKNEQIGNLDVYVWVNLSCNQIRNVVKRILKKFNIPFSQFKVFLRADYKDFYKKDLES